MLPAKLMLVAIPVALFVILLQAGYLLFFPASRTLLAEAEPITEFAC